MSSGPIACAVLALICLPGLSRSASADVDVGPRHVNAIVVDPGNAANVYAASSDGLYKSTDAGGSWRLLAGGLPPAAATGVVVAKANPQVVYAVASNAVFISQDGGASWQSGAASVSFVAGDPTNASIAYAGRTAGGANLSKTIDGGATWTPAPIVDTDAQQPGATVATSVRRVVVDPNAPAFVYAAVHTTVTNGSTVTEFDKIFRSANGGAAWTAVSPGGDNLTINPLNSRLFRSVLDYVHYSDDGGHTWISSFTAFIDSHGDNAVRDIAFDPRDAARIYVLTGVGVKVRNDRVNDGNFKLLTPGMVAPNALAVDPAHPGVLYFGSACAGPNRITPPCAGVMKTRDEGVSSESLVPGHRDYWLTGLAPSATNPHRIYASVIDVVHGTNVVLRSDDGGLIWNVRSPDFVTERRALPERFSVAVSPGSDGTVYGLGDSLAVSTDGGLLFQGNFACAASHVRPHLAVARSNPAVSYMTVPGCWFVSSTDGMLTRQLSQIGDLGFDPALVAVDPVASSTVYVSGVMNGADALMKSVDGGAHFSVLPFAPAQPILDLAIDPAAPNTIYVATGSVSTRDGRVFRSTNGGGAWAQVGSIELLNIAAIAVGPGTSTLYVADPDRGIYALTPDGLAWNLSGPEGVVILAAAAGPSATLYAGTASGAVWRIEPERALEIRARLDRTAAVAGAPIEFEVTGIGGMPPREYRVRRFDPASGWTVVQEFGAARSYAWTPGNADAGAHTLEVTVRAQGSATIDAVIELPFFVDAAPDQRAVIPFDFDGDAFKDLLLYDRVTGAWTIGIGNTQHQFTAGPSGGWAPGWDVSVADFNGDGLDDFFLYNAASGAWYKVINTGGGFTYFSQGWQPGFNVSIVDFNADGKSDVFVYNPATGVWFTCVSTGSGTQGFTYHSGSWVPGWRVFPADFNGDGKTDLFLYDPIGGLYYKAITGAGADFTYAGGVWAPGWTPFVTDLDGDGHADIFLYDKPSGLWYRCVSAGSGTGGFIYTAGQWAAGWDVQVADFYRDSISDLFLYNRDSGFWYKAINSGSAFTYTSGTWAQWRTIVTDLDGDGTSDLLLVDAAARTYYQARSITPTVFTYTFGTFP